MFIYSGNYKKVERIGRSIERYVSEDITAEVFFRVYFNQIKSVNIALLELNREKRSLVCNEQTSR